MTTDETGGPVPAPQAGGDMPLGARIHRLQRIVSDLEREDIELEDAMRLFEEGVSHLRAAEALVTDAELRIERLLEDARGTRTAPVERPG